jgi:hypothetical protein
MASITKMTAANAAQAHNGTVIGSQSSSAVRGVAARRRLVPE